MERHTFVVAFDKGGGTVHKLLKVEKKTDVLEQAKRLFMVTGEFRVEYFFEPCEVFVEVDSLEELPDSGKVQIIPVLESALDPESPARLSAASTIDLSAGDQIILREFSVTPTTSTAICQQSSASSMDGSSIRGPDEDQVLELRGAEAEGGVHDREADDVRGEPEDVHETERQFFDPATLTRNLRLKLQQGVSKLENREWSQLLDSVYTRYTNIARGNEPTKHEYQAMVSQILEAYPTLRGRLNLGDGLVMVKRLLRDKFRNKRAALKRQLSPESRMNSPAPMKHRRVSGLANYCPVGGLDGVALQRKVNEMTTASSAEEVNKLLQETFEGRRRKLLKGGSAEVLSEYPRLFDDDGFYREVDRIAGEDGFVAKKVATVTQRLDALGRNLRCASRDVALRQTMHLLGTSHDAVFKSGDDPAAAGMLNIRCESVVMGDVTLVSADDQVTLLVCLVLAHSVLNMAFVKNKAFMAYFQKYLLGIDDGCPVPQKALRFHQQTAAE